MKQNVRCCNTDDLLTHQYLRRQAIELRNSERQAKEEYEVFLDMAMRLTVLGLILTAILLAIFLPKGGRHEGMHLAPVPNEHRSGAPAVTDGHSS